MPWLEVHKRCNKIESVCSGNRYNKLAKRLVRADEPENDQIRISDVASSHHSLGEILPPRDSVRNREVNCIAGTPQSDNIAEPEQDHC